MLSKPRGLNYYKQMIIAQEKKQSKDQDVKPGEKEKATQQRRGIQKTKRNSESLRQLSF